MPYYRLYFMNPKGGHIVRFEEYEAADDEEAVTRTAEHQGARPLELWCRDRKVKRIEAVGASGERLRAAE